MKYTSYPPFSFIRWIKASISYMYFNVLYRSAPPMTSLYEKKKTLSIGKHPGPLVKEKSLSVIANKIKPTGTKQTPSAFDSHNFCVEYFQPHIFQPF